MTSCFLHGALPWSSIGASQHPAIIDERSHVPFCCWDRGAPVFDNCLSSATTGTPPSQVIEDAAINSSPDGIIGGAIRNLCAPQRNAASCNAIPRGGGSEMRRRACTHKVAQAHSSGFKFNQK